MFRGSEAPGAREPPVSSSNLARSGPGTQPQKGPRSRRSPTPTCGAGIDHPGLRQPVLQVQDGLAHLRGAGVLGFVALIEHDLGQAGVKDCSGRQAAPQALV